MMDGNNSCCKCVIDFKDSDVIFSCDGACVNKYHQKCLKINSTGLKTYNDCSNLKVLCDECLKDPVMTLNVTMKKILSYMCIIDERLNRQDKKLENINDALTKVDESLEITKVTEQSIVAIDERYKVDKNLNTNDKQVGLYSDVLRNKFDPVILVKPKKYQKCEETRADLNKNIDPTKLAISNVHNMPKDTIAINCKTNDEILKLKDKALKIMKYKFPMCE